MDRDKARQELESRWLKDAELAYYIDFAPRLRPYWDAERSGDIFDAMAGQDRETILRLCSYRAQQECLAVWMGTRMIEALGGGTKPRYCARLKLNENDSIWFETDLQETALLGALVLAIEQNKGVRRWGDLDRMTPHGLREDNTPQLWILEQPMFAIDIIFKPEYGGFRWEASLRWKETMSELDPELVAAWPRRFARRAIAFNFCEGWLLDKQLLRLPETIPKG